MAGTTAEDRDGDAVWLVQSGGRLLLLVLKGTHVETGIPAGDHQI